MKITFYSTHCPQCMGIEMQLKKKKIEYEEIITTNDKMIELGFTAAPTITAEDENGVKAYMGAKECFEFLKGVN